MNSLPRKSTTRNAFTLIEIMVATVIMVIMVGLVIQITGEVLKVWNRSSGRLSANAQARIALELLTQDLETAVLRNNGQQWLRVEGPEDVAGDVYDSQTVAVKLFAPALDRQLVDPGTGDDIPGDICGIAYRLEYKETYTGGLETYALYRAIERPDVTFNVLMGSPSDPNSPQLNLEGTKPASGTSPASGVWNETAIVADENYLASNIVDFKVIVYVDDGSGNQTPDPVNADPSTLELLVGEDYIFGGNSGIQDPPLYMDIILTVLSDQGMEILQNLADGRAGTGYTGDSGLSPEEQVVREHGEVFTRRVNFMARPL